MRIILDGMGGDHAPDAIVEGAVQAAALLKDTDEICITGPEALIREKLRKYGYRGHKITVCDAQSVITNDEAPVMAVRSKKDSSIVKGLHMVKDGEGDVFISAGSTGALLAGGLLILGRAKGIDRPTLATVYPVLGSSQPSLLTDAGANAECKPRNLFEFGVMGSIYMEKVMKRRNPTVGLVNLGTEKEKGTPLTKEAYAMLENSDLNFIGNIETRELQNAVCDVIVTDGFTGNACIKLTEGLGLSMLKMAKGMFMSSPKTKVAALMMKNQLTDLKHQLDYKEYGGAPILGLRKALLKMHGSSDALAVRQTILKAVPYVEEGVVETIAQALGDRAKALQKEEQKDKQ